MITLPSYPKVNLIGFILASLAIIVSIFLQLHYHIDPCPLCIVQRLLMVFIAVLFLIATLHTPQPLGRRVFGGVLCLLSLAGVAISGWQVWLQHLPPDKAPACGASLDYMLHNLPFYEMVQLVLKGTADCARVNWSFLGISMAQMAVAVFILLALIAATHIIRKK
ncbi:disulfide bond formation protein B [soil metagenome]